MPIFSKNKIKYEQDGDGLLTPLVTDGIIGIARNRNVQVNHDTAPTLAGTGVASWTTGVRGIVIYGVKVLAGTVPTATANNNWAVRYAVDSPSDAYAAAVLPSATTPGAAVDIGHVGEFNLVPVFVYHATTPLTWLILPAPVFIDVSEGITRLDFRHNLGTGVNIELMIGSVEVQS